MLRDKIQPLSCFVSLFPVIANVVTSAENQSVAGSFTVNSDDSSQRVGYLPSVCTLDYMILRKEIDNTDYNKTEAGISHT